MNIFLLRGLVREKRHWGDFVDKIQKAYPDAKIYTPEIQGVGEYHDMTSPDSLEEMVDFMRSKFQTQIESSDDNLLIAISLGGMMSRCWMEKYPDDFKKVVLMNTSFRGISKLFHRLQPSALFTFVRLFLTINTAFRELGILRLVSNSPEDKLQAILPSWIKIQKDAPVKKNSFIAQIKAALKYHPPLEKPKAQLLILAGAADRLCHCQCSIDVYKTWGGKLELHPYAGHDLPMDAPEWIIKHIKIWV